MANAKKNSKGVPIGVQLTHAQIHAMKAKKKQEKGTATKEK